MLEEARIFLLVLVAITRALSFTNFCTLWDSGMSRADMIATGSSKSILITSHQVEHDYKNFSVEVSSPSLPQREGKISRL